MPAFLFSKNRKRKQKSLKKVKKNCFTKEKQQKAEKEVRCRKMEKRLRL